MARGYIRVNEDGTFNAVRAMQGMLSNIDSDAYAYGYGKRIKSVLARTSPKPGLYRCSFTSDRTMLFFSIGAKVNDAAKEATRLAGQLSKASVVARTGMPGITGYQQSADAATARLMNNRQETKYLIEWLECA